MDAPLRTKRTQEHGTKECGVEESRSHDGAGDCAVDEPRGSQGGGGGGTGDSGDCAGGGCDCERDSKGRTVDLCGGGIERTDGGAGCGGVSADVWDFAEAGAGVDCGRKARDYRRRWKERRIPRGTAERDLRARKLTAERRGGGNCGERDDAVRAGGAAICAKTRGDDGGGDFEPADAGGAAGEDRDCAGGRAGSVDGVDAVEGGNVAEDGAEHAVYSGDGAAGTCV